MTEYVNDLPAATRRPRARLMLGTEYIQFERMTISHSGTHQAGTFTVTIRSTPGSDVGQWGWWFQQSVIILDMFVGFPKDPDNFTSSDLTQVFVGRADSISLNAATNTIELQGRDLSAILIDKKTSGQFQNKTASDVAKQFATDAGLAMEIQPTTKKIGTFYAQDYVRQQHEETQWALLTYLAQKEAVQCFVLGRTLYFGQYQNQAAKSYGIWFQPADDNSASHRSNAKKLTFEHDLTLARDVIVTVRSANAKSKNGFTAVAKASHGKAQAARSLTPILPASAADVQNYTYTIPGLSQQQAQEKAQQLAAEIAKHEIRFTADLPGDAVLYPWVPVEIIGTGTLFDATYYPSNVERTITPNDFTMSVRGKNHPTGTEVTL